MRETLRCPACSTRYVIGPERVRPGLRQARCFRCAAVFDIGEAVARLLAATPAEPELPPVLAAAPGPGAGFEPGAEARPEPGFQPEETVGGGAGFLSARDAIEKLLGQAPPAPAPVRMPTRAGMDLEATLQALDTTLGGAPAPEPAAEPAAEPALGLAPGPVPEPAPQSAFELVMEPPAVPAPEPAAAKSDTASTVKLTPEEIRVAMAAAAAAMAAPAPAPEPEPERPPEPEPAAAQELLKVQVETETTTNVTVDQMTAWIEQGRVQEYHLVARQHSENWIEAGKVPALRPAFDRVRRTRASEEAAKPAPEPPPVKRGLFSGLFGRN